MVVTFFQQDIAWGDAQANRRKVEHTMASQAAGADIFVVPETFTTGFGSHMAALAETREGDTLQWARRMAAAYDLLFVGTWVVAEGDRCYNRLHWVYPDGRYGFYDKAHTFRVSGESDQIARGTLRTVFEWRGWRIKPAVCYDLRFPSWLRNELTDVRHDGQPLAYDLLLACANWPASRREAWTTLLKARAIENLCYAVGCNRTGTDEAGIAYSGDSLAADFRGLPLAEATGEQTVTVTLDRTRLAAFRQHWPFFLDFD